MTVVRFVLGGFLGLFAFVALCMGQFVTALFWGLSTLVLLPPGLKWIERRSGLRFKTWLKYVSVIGLYSVGASAFDAPKIPKPADPKALAPVVIRDTVFLRDTVRMKDTTATTRPQKKARRARTPATPSNSFAPAPQPYTTPTQTAPKKVRQSRPRGCTYNGHPLYVGSRGGCYYYTASGRKEYVDRSLCSGCE
ncbi:MAG: hypothetical protein U0U46_16235 [Saprospiraceae bacterium]